MAFKNDPKFADIPAVGSAAGVLVAPRTQSGEAVRWSKDGDPQALQVFLGDAYAVFEGQVMKRRIPFGSGLDPVEWLTKEVVLIRPPAGELIVLTEDLLTQQYAMVDPSTGDMEFIQPVAKSDRVVKPATEGEVL